MGRWKQANWDKWTFWKKVRHVLGVIASIVSIILMCILFLYVVLILFGIQGWIHHVRDTILLEIMKGI